MLSLDFRVPLRIVGGQGALVKTFYYYKNGENLVVVASSYGEAKKEAEDLFGPGGKLSEAEEIASAIK